MLVTPIQAIRSSGGAGRDEPLCRVSNRWAGLHTTRPQTEPYWNQGARFWDQNPTISRIFSNGRYWARTSDLRLVESTCGVSYVALRGRNLVFMRVSGLLADLADA
jgi:hypothetical protein